MQVSTRFSILVFATSWLAFAPTVNAQNQSEPSRPSPTMPGFAVVATGNDALEPYAVRSIQGGSQQVLVTRPAPATNSRAGLGESRGMMLDLLQAVVREGTGKAARLPNVAAGGKTGTTQEYRDAWFVGFTPDLIVGVWVGNDDNAPMNKVVGGDLPAEIWRDFLTRADAALAKGKRPPSSTQMARKPDPRQESPPPSGRDRSWGARSHRYRHSSNPWGSRASGRYRR